MAPKPAKYVGCKKYIRAFIHRP